MTWTWWEVERLGGLRPKRGEIAGRNSPGASNHIAQSPPPRGRSTSVKLAVRVLAIALPSLMSLGCAAAAGAGVAAAALGAAVATSECYGYVDVLVTEGTTGTRQCDARVNARQGNDVVPFRSCFYAPLTKGKWQLSVDKPGYESVKSEIDIDPRDNCRRIVHHVSVRLDSLNAPRRSNFGELAPRPSEPAPPPAAPPPPSQPTPGPAPPVDEAAPTAPPAPGEPVETAPSDTPAAPAPATSSTPPPAAPPTPAPPPAAPPSAAPPPGPPPAAPPKPEAPKPPAENEPAPPTRSFPEPG